MKLVDIPLPDAVGVLEPTDDLVEVPAVGIEIDGGAVGRPVMLGRQEVGERLQPPIECASSPYRVARAIAWLNSSPETYSTASTPLMSPLTPNGRIT